MSTLVLDVTKLLIAYNSIIYKKTRTKKINTSNLLTRDRTGESRIVCKRLVDVGKLEASITTGQSWSVRTIRLPILLLLVFFCFYHQR